MSRPSSSVLQESSSQNEIIPTTTAPTEQTEDPQESEIVPNVIIFHPGSRNLRIGRSTDSSPLTFLHAIGRRRKQHQGAGMNTLRRDGLLPNGCCGSVVPPEVESARLQLCHTLQNELKSDGNARLATSQKISGYNQLAKGIINENAVMGTWKEFREEEIVVGDDIFLLNPDGEFNIHFPWKRGELNVHENIGGSLSSVVTDLWDIWKYGLQMLKVPLEDLKIYRAVVVIPVMFSKSHAKEILNMLLNGGFGAAFLAQDHVCASFGVGMSTVTVVDVGDQKISISCVEDGISIPHSRVLLKYGGIDLTYTFLYLMQKSALPFTVDGRCIWDINLINNLKEKLCHLDLNRCGLEEHDVLWEKPGTLEITYKLRFGDELLITPLSYFSPDILRGTVSYSSVVFHQTLSYLPEDPLEIFMNDNKKGKEVDEEDHFENLEENGPDSFLQTKKPDHDSILGIDYAIIQSIESIDANDELKRRLYSKILIVGGGFKFKNICSYLKNKLKIVTPRAFKSDLDVITESEVNDIDVALTSWKGASILVQLETASELWITQPEWNKYGFKILREKSLFTF